MRTASWPFRWWACLLVPLLAAASCGLLNLLTPTDAPVQQREAARARWAARPFSSYRIAIRIEFGGNTCTQELETRGEQLHRILTNNCRLSWLGLSTVARLFEVSELLDRPTPCYSSMQSCACYRVRQGSIPYDSQLGYPTTVVYRRDVQPNVTNAEYWRRLWDTRRVPTCGPNRYDVIITVTSLKPLA